MNDTCSINPVECVYPEMYSCDKDCPSYSPLNCSIGDVLARQCSQCGKWAYRYKDLIDFFCCDSSPSRCRDCWIKYHKEQHESAY